MSRQNAPPGFKCRWRQPLNPRDGLRIDPDDDTRRDLVGEMGDVERMVAVIAVRAPHPAGRCGNRSASAFSTFGAGCASAAPADLTGVRGRLAIAAATAPRSISGVIGFRRKSVAPSRIASTASSIDANAVTITTHASGTRAFICRSVSSPSIPGIF